MVMTNYIILFFLSNVKRFRMWTRNVQANIISVYNLFMVVNVGIVTCAAYHVNTGVYCDVYYKKYR